MLLVQRSAHARAWSEHSPSGTHALLRTLPACAPHPLPADEIEQDDDVDGTVSALSVALESERGRSNSLGQQVRGWVGGPGVGGAALAEHVPASRSQPLSTNTPTHAPPPGACLGVLVDE